MSLLGGCIKEDYIKGEFIALILNAEGLYSMWYWVERVEAMGFGFDAYRSKDGKRVRQVWDDGYVEEFECP